MCGCVGVRVCVCVSRSFLQGISPVCVCVCVCVRVSCSVWRLQGSFNLPIPFHLPPPPPSSHKLPAAKLLSLPITYPFHPPSLSHSFPAFSLSPSRYPSLFRRRVVVAVVVARGHRLFIPFPIRGQNSIISSHLVLSRLQRYLSFPYLQIDYLYNLNLSCSDPTDNR